jgi:hypothetical protein
MNMTFPAATLSAIKVKTVPSNYCWDEGVPNFATLVDAQETTVDGVTTYIGYAPYMFVSVASDIIPGFITLDNLSATRIIDFGDYYNLSSIKTELGNDGNLAYDNVTNSYERVGFCHTYIMPGTYHVSIDSYSFLSKPRIKIKDVNQVHVELNQPATEFTIIEYLPKLTSVDIYDNGKYIRTVNGVPLKIRSTGEIYGALTRDSNNFIYTEEQSNITTVTKTDIFSNVQYKVQEIAPTASVALVNQLPSTLTFPVTAEFTAKYTKAGSFPIEKIAWDMGDGSPIKIQSRYSINTDVESGFIENGSTDLFTITDPRFFNVKHVYKSNPEQQTTFNVSITAYAANTNLFSVDTLQYGPLHNPDFNVKTIKILQAEFTDNGKIYLGEIENMPAIWYADK